MEEIALIGDIHGNLPALEAVLNDIEKRNIKRIMCLGDVVGKGPNNAETLDICREKCEFILKGNWEHYVGSYTPKWSAIWVQGQLGYDRVEYIRNLKMSYEIWISGKLMRMFHASPNSFNRVFSSASAEDKKELFIDRDNGVFSDIAVYADIHRPYMQTIDGKILVNIGSVGNPLDIPLCSYVIVKGEVDSKVKAGFSFETVRLPYDIDRAVEDAKSKEGFPEIMEYIGELTECKYNRKQ